jgi:hypothetical protein
MPIWLQSIAKAENVDICDSGSERKLCTSTLSQRGADQQALKG